jgi:hypothetical protein
MDLAPFEAIDPCGYKDLQMTQLKTFTNSISIESAGLEIANNIKNQLLNLKSLNLILQNRSALKKLTLIKHLRFPLKLLGLLSRPSRIGSKCSYPKAVDSMKSNQF